MSIDTNAILKSGLRQTNVEIEKDDVQLYGLLPKEVEAKHKRDKTEWLLDQLPFSFTRQPLDRLPTLSEANDKGSVSSRAISSNSSARRVSSSGRGR